MATLLQDLRFGVRMLFKDRSFTLTALLTLAVCIAANAAMFTIVRSVLLKPLPFPESDRVVLLYNSYPNAGAPRVGNAVPDYFDRQTAVPALVDQAVFRREGMTLGEASGAERVTSIRATPSFFRLMKISAHDGRLFADPDGEVGQHQKVLLAHAFWRRKFGDARAVGQSLRLNGQPFEIVGVLPRAFSFLQNDIDVFVPAAFAPADKGDDRRHSNNWQQVGRLAPDASIEQARQQIAALNAANDVRFPNFRQILKDARFETVSVFLQDDLVRDVRAVLYLLWGGVAFVLLIGAVNIANLVMVRASGRTREMATRHAIGGDLGRLARQLLTETTVLALAGGTLGLLLGWMAVRGVGTLNLDQVPRLYEVTLDWTVVGLVTGLTLLVGLVIGVAPVLRLWHMNLNAELREETRGGTSGRRATLVRRVLAMAQVALALILLIGAGLLLASFRAVMQLDLGFTPGPVTTASVTLPGSAYGAPAARVTFAQRALAAIRGIPGVTHAGATTGLPFGGNVNNNVIMAEGYVMKPGESLLAPASTIASDGYFNAMNIAIVKGRAFDTRDASTAPGVVMVDERLARKFWPDQDPIGRRLYRPSDPSDVTKITPQTRFLDVVGVVREVQMSDPRMDVTPVGTYYLPFEQSTPGGFTFVVTTSRPVPTLAADLRRVINAIDPELALFRVQPMQKWIDDVMISRRLPMLIALAFAGIALFLAAVGIYGVLAYGVTERRRELGVRMALGGSASSVFGLVLVDGLKVAGVGLTVGLASAYFVGRMMQSLLFNVSPLSPTVLVLVSVVLGVVALVASGIPALRASRINPIIVLGR